MNITSTTTEMEIRAVELTHLLEEHDAGDLPEDALRALGELTRALHKTIG